MHTLKTKALMRLCEVHGLPTPQPEYRFHPKRAWRVDYYLERDGIRVALEVEGGVWIGGRHNRAKGFLEDIEKYNALSLAKIYLIRTTPSGLLTIKTMNILKQFFE